MYVDDASRRKRQWFGNGTKRRGSLVDIVVHGVVRIGNEWCWTKMNWFAGFAK